MNPYYQPYWADSDVNSDELEHYGILGMKWGLRRYQNADGTLTSAGKKRYANDTKEQIERSERRKAKVVKGAKTAVKVGAAVAVTAVAGVSVAKVLKSTGALSAGGKALNSAMKAYGGLPAKSYGQGATPALSHPMKSYGQGVAKATGGGPMKMYGQGAKSVSSGPMKTYSQGIGRAVSGGPMKMYGPAATPMTGATMRSNRQSEIDDILKKARAARR